MAYFYAYVCRRRPLRLPQSADERVRLPQGWASSAREMVAK